jgi:uncharacterized paraquat-inducible protein A
MSEFLSKLLRFIKALYFHIGYGLPKCTQQQIDKRYAICIECDFFDKRYSQCLQCGCNLSNKKKFLNKLAWSDQHCPINKWQEELLS